MISESLKHSYKRLVVLFLFIFIQAQAFGQLIIKFPVERAVYQRNNSNLGNISITGTVSEECDRVEARLIARVVGQGVTTSWVTIDAEVAAQSFTGKIQNVGGWYKLEVRGIKNEEVLFKETIERVGIGEVFVIAGQSNAQGDGVSPNPKGAVDDRVNAYGINYFDFDKTDKRYYQNEILSAMLTLLKDTDNSINSLFRSIDNDTEPLIKIAE